ncbi:MAG: hypothetical protein NTW96_24550 [Planctomycetia bacterium]|nr:hypothetical protein [Planctomycetia bacterium]
MGFDARALLGTLFQPSATSPADPVEVIDQLGDLGAYVREHGCYPPEGLAGWEWKPGERPGPPDPPVIDWEDGIPFTV